MIAHRLLPIAALLLAACKDTGGPNAQLSPVMQIIDGDNQVDTVGQQLPVAITARAADKQSAAPIGNVVLNWYRVVGTDTVFLGAGLTDVSGEAKIRPSLATKAGGQQVVAFALDAAGDRVEHALASMTALADRGVTTLGARTDTVDVFVGEPVLHSISYAAAYDQYGNYAGPLHWVAAAGWRVSADTCWAEVEGVTDMQLRRDAATAHVVLRAKNK